MISGAFSNRKAPAKAMAMNKAHDWIVRQAEQSGQSSCTLTAGHRQMGCIVGRSGIIQASEKREGDGFSPAGRWPLRAVLYRSDRTAPPQTGDSEIGVHPITAEMGWCDEPHSNYYNQLVGLPFAERHEHMMRQDSLYDIVVVLGYNDAPAVPNFGSAIFLHCKETDTACTAGCVALFRDELCWLLARAVSSQHIRITQMR